MVNWWFGLVVWIPGIPLWKGLLLKTTPRIPNHRAPNHQFTICWITRIPNIYRIGYQKRCTNWSSDTTSLRYKGIGMSHNLLLYLNCYAMLFPLKGKHGCFWQIFASAYSENFKNLDMNSLPMPVQYPAILFQNPTKLQDSGQITTANS